MFLPVPYDEPVKCIKYLRGIHIKAEKKVQVTLSQVMCKTIKI